jgi:hypothetical protein
MMHDSGGGIHPGSRRRRNSLGWVLALGTLILGIGCGVQSSRLGPGNDFAGGIRWAAGDMSRLLRTVHYFKLLGQPELGVKELEAAHRLDPGNLKVADALAQFYDELGLGERAQQVYLEALALAPDNPALQNNLCFSYYQAGNWNQAETCYRQTLARHPDNQAARNNLGLVLCRQGRQGEARQLWQEAEGEAAAAGKLAAALAALGMAGEPRYAQQTRPQPPGQSGSRHSPPGGHPVTATAGPPPSPASSPAVNHQIETATPPAAPSSPQPAPGLAAGNRPARSLPPQGEMAAAPPPQSPLGKPATPVRPGKAALPPLPASQPGLHVAAGTTSSEKLRANRLQPITVKELVETNIAILNGNGIQDLARELRSQLNLEGYGAVAIKNFRDFGVDRTVIYYRPESERVATNLNKKFFPGAELKPEARLADNIDIKVVLGHDLGPQQLAKAPQGQAPRL